MTGLDTHVKVNINIDVIKQLLTLQYLEHVTSRLLWVKVQKEML